MNGLHTQSITQSGPKILLADTNRWALSARLAIVLAQTGCHVSAVCVLPNHPLQKTRAVRRTLPYQGFRPLLSLMDAITAVQPDLVIPCCDRSVAHLHELHATASKDGNQRLAELIERSIGPGESHFIVSSRFELLKMASEEGVRVPPTERLDRPESLAAWLGAERLPFVLKADGTWGGGGVKVVHHSAELPLALQQLGQLFCLKRALKRLIVNRDSFWLHSWFNRVQHEVIVQAYVPGRPANCAVACWRGEILGGIAVEVVQCEGSSGPASVVRVVNNPEMMAAAKRIANRLGLSGLFGLDFMIEEGSGHAYLIEMNPRPTPLSHLRLGRGRDMVGSLKARLTSQEIQEVPPVTESDTIAYFPQAENIPANLLESSFLDFPDGEEELVRELSTPWPDRTLLFRLSTRLSRRRAEKSMATDSDPDAFRLKSTEVCSSRPANTTGSHEIS